MSCRHCETIRDEQRRFVARHGQRGFGAWVHEGVKVPTFDEVGMPVLDRHLNQTFHNRRVDVPRWTRFPPSALADCRCDCHMVARIGGLLPRLEW